MDREKLEGMLRTVEGAYDKAKRPPMREEQERMASSLEQIAVAFTAMSVATLTEDLEEKQSDWERQYKRDDEFAQTLTYVLEDTTISPAERNRRFGLVIEDLRNHDDGPWRLQEELGDKLLGKLRDEKHGSLEIGVEFG